MMNVKTICKEVASKVKNSIEEAIDGGFKSVNVELMYGTACVQVYSRWEDVSGWLVPETQVNVFHEDDSHESPLLEAAISAAIPTWDDVEKGIENEAFHFSIFKLFDR